MSFGIYRQSTEIKRLSGVLEQRGSRMGLSTFGMIAFGLVFFGMGTIVMLIGTKTVEVDPASIHAPYWVLTMVGLVFAAAGAAMWGKAWKQFVWNSRRAEVMKRHPDEPALADFAWDERGFTPPHWKKVANAVVGAAFMTAFLSIFNWWAFLNRGPIPVKIVVGIFDGILIFIYWNLFLTFGRALKFGDSRIEFGHFPFRTNEPIQIFWHTPSGISRSTGGTFTLRCVKEWYERRGAGKDASNFLVQEEQWSGTWPVDQPEEFLPGKGVEFNFDPPQDLPSTHLDAVEVDGGRVNVKLPGVRWTKTSAAPQTVVFWEFEVKLQLPGLDFEEKYLVPVYESKMSTTTANANV